MSILAGTRGTSAINDNGASVGVCFYFLDFRKQEKSKSVTFHLMTFPHSCEYHNAFP